MMLLTACGQKSEVPRLNDRTDTLSWAMGENMAFALSEMQGVELDMDLVKEALQHTLDGKKQPLSDSAFREAINYLMMLRQKEALERADETKSLIDSRQEAYMAQLQKERPNVKKHPMGFYYEVLKEGKGPKAQERQRVKFDYRSFLLFSGEPYDQTYGKRDPIVHVVGKPMFDGLIEGLQLMNAGSTYRFYFPYQVAFGPQGSGDIPGYTPFIYEVELHEIYNN